MILIYIPLWLNINAMRYTGLKDKKGIYIPLWLNINGLIKHIQYLTTTIYIPLWLNINEYNPDHADVIIFDLHSTMVKYQPKYPFDFDVDSGIYIPLWLNIN